MRNISYLCNRTRNSRGGSGLAGIREEYRVLRKPAGLFFLWLFFSGGIIPCSANDKGFLGGLPSADRSHNPMPDRNDERWDYVIWINAFIPHDIDVVKELPGSGGRKTMISVSRKFKDKISTVGATAGAVGGMVFPGVNPMDGAEAGRATTKALLGGCFGTDERSYKDNPDASFRVQTRIMGKRFSSQSRITNECKETVKYECKTGRKLEAETCKLAKRFMKGTITKLAVGDDFKYRIRMAAKNPLQAFAPSIDYDIVLTEKWNEVDRNLEVQVDGLVNGFPAYEVYVNFNGKTESVARVYPKEGVGPEALIGKANVPFKGSSGPIRYPE